VSRKVDRKLTTLQRLKLIKPKIKELGVSWFLKRVFVEFNKPTTTPGIKLRAITANGYGIILHTLAFPLRIITRDKKGLYLFYDLDVSPVTFDFCFALIAAELERKRKKLSHIHICIVPGTNDGLRKEDEDYEQIVDRNARHWRIHNLITPLTQHMPSVRGITICSTRKQATLFRLLYASGVYPKTYWPLFPIPHTPNEVLAHAQDRNTTHPFKATEQSKKYIAEWLKEKSRGKKVVAITLRQYDFMPNRNSNLKAWTDFASIIKLEGYFPIFIEDTEASLSPRASELNGFEVCTAASWNMGIRMALYEAAWLNMLVNNGPFGCLAFSECPYLMFKIITKGVRMTSPEYMQSLGYILDETPPFATDKQKWVWKEDSLETLLHEFRMIKDKLA